MTVFTGGEAIEAFLEELDGWLSKSVTSLEAVLPLIQP